MKIIPHPDGTRRIAILCRDDGMHTFHEEHLAAADEGAIVDDEPGDPVWMPDRPGLAGLHGTLADADDDAMKWFAGYRSVH